LSAAVSPPAAVITGAPVVELVVASHNEFAVTSAVPALAIGADKTERTPAVNADTATKAMFCLRIFFDIDPFLLK
jgi:hypothetical protein